MAKRASSCAKNWSTFSGMVTRRPFTDDESVFYNSEERDGLSAVSSLQVYLDLRKNPARGEEAAAELLRRSILPRFSPGSTT